MRNIIRFALLAATAVSPLAAQDWNPGNRPEARQEARQNRAEIRGDRQEIRQGRAEVRGDVARGDFREARQDRREVQRDRAELRGDQREAYRDRQAVRDGRDGTFQERRRDDRQNWNDNRGDRRDDRRDWRDDRGRDNRGNGYAYGRGDDRGRGPDRGWDNRGRGNNWNNGGWNNGWRNDNRYNWQGYRSSNRNLYRMPRYAAPRGYARGYSRWSAGSRIQPYFYGQNYWINDPYRYRLPPAYGGYRWVRYYDDVALVDIRSGLIADIIYSFFY